MGIFSLSKKIAKELGEREKKEMMMKESVFKYFFQNLGGCNLLVLHSLVQSSVKEPRHYLR